MSDETKTTEHAVQPAAISGRAANPLAQLWTLWSFVWKHSQGRRGKVCLYLGLFVGANVVSTSEPLVMGLIFNYVQRHGVTPENIGTIIGLFALLPARSLLYWAFHGPARVIENRNAFLARADYQESLMKGVINMPLAWHAEHQSGDTIDKIEKSSSALEGFAQGTFLILGVFLSLGISIGVLTYYNGAAGASVATMVVLSFCVIAAFDSRLVPAYKEINLIENARGAVIYDTLSNITTIVTLRKEEGALRKVRAAIYRAYGRFSKMTELTELKWFSARLCAQAVVLVTIVLYLTQHAGETVLVGTIYMLYGYANRVAENFDKFADLQSSIIRRGATLGNAKTLTDAFTQAGEKGQGRLPGTWKLVEIQGLSFSYHLKEGVDLHLQDVWMRIGRGEKIAVIGESGSGKSSFLKVLRGLFEAQGQVKVDGEMVKEGLRGIQALIALVPQDPELFADTIEENVVMGDKYDKDEVETTLDRARFTDVAERLPRGLQSSIKEKGVNLSGGEKQRLALARGLLAARDADILLLDEPTSSVDFRNELAIYENIFLDLSGKTVISAVHRLHLLPLFDTIYLFGGGRVVAAGSLESCLRTSEDFRSLWNKYLEAHKDDEQDMGDDA